MDGRSKQSQRDLGEGQQKAMERSNTQQYPVIRNKTKS